MQQNFHVFSGIATMLAVFVLPVGAQEEAPAEAPVRALIVSGGASHEFEVQSQVLRIGIEERVSFPIEWNLRLDDRGRSDRRHPVFQSDEWADKHDIVIHHHCYTRVSDGTYLEQVLAPHLDGKAALVLHSSLRSFPTADSRWAAFCGVRTSHHDPEGSVVVNPLSSNHKLSANLLSWTSDGEELYQIEELYPGVAIHAEGRGSKSNHAHPVIWSHEFGPSRARVVGSSLGNSIEAIRQPELLDSLARGFLWALKRGSSEDFKAISRENSLKALQEEERVELLNPGFTQLTQAVSSAMSEDVKDGNLAPLAIDGRTDTFWQTEVAGPSVLNISLKEPLPITAVAIEWLEQQPPDYTLEGSFDEVEWVSLVSGGQETESMTHSLYHFPELNVKALRLSISATRPGERPGVREISAYRDQSEIPAAFAVEAGLSDGLLAVESVSVPRNLRLHPDWTIGRIRAKLPSTGIPTQFVERSDGGGFLVIELSSGSQVLQLTPGGEATVFLDQLDQQCSITWDGEWLYVLQGFALEKFRDTNQDHIADERHRLGTIYATKGTEVDFGRMILAIDGWIYVTHHSDEASMGANSKGRPVDLEANGIARFQRDGSRFQPFVSASSEVVEFEPLGALSFRVATAGKDERLSGRKMQYGVFPGRPLESFPLLSSAERIYTSRQDFVVPASQGSDYSPVAQINGLKAVFQTSRGLLAFHEAEGETRAVELLSGTTEMDPSPELDSLNDLQLFPLLSSPSPHVQAEAVFEILRRKRDWNSEVEALLQDRNSPSYIPSLALLSQMESPRTFSLLTDAARLSHSAAAFRLLGDLDEAENHPVLGEITQSTDPVTTTEILAAIARSESVINGLERLVLSFAGVEDERLSRTAVEWLVQEEAGGICFEAIDNPDTSASEKEAALQVLSRLHRATVVEGLVFRLERTTDHQFRREALETLCQLYFRSGEGWGSTSLVDSFLRASLTDRRVDTSWLLDRMLHWEIPIRDLEQLAAASRSQLSLQPATIDLMVEKQEVPESARSWLAEIIAEESHDPNLRAKALALLNDNLEFARSIEKSEQLLSTSLIPEAQKALLRSWRARLEGKGNEGAWDDLSKDATLLSSLLNGDVKGNSSDSPSATSPYESGHGAFHRLRCDACHNIHGEGAHIGPDLVLWIQENTLSEFREAIMDPDHEIRQDYVPTVFELKNGTIFQGLVKAKGDDELLIADSAGNSFRLDRSRIASQSPSTSSIMPNDLFESASEEDIENIAQFLRQLGSLHSLSND